MNCQMKKETLYKAMQEEDFWSSWLRGDEKSVEGEKRKTEEEKEENETATVEKKM